MSKYITRGQARSDIHKQAKRSDAVESYSFCLDNSQHLSNVQLKTDCADVSLRSLWIWGLNSSRTCATSVGSLATNFRDNIFPFKMGSSWCLLTLITSFQTTLRCVPEELRLRMEWSSCLRLHEVLFLASRCIQSWYFRVCSVRLSRARLC